MGQPPGHGGATGVAQGGGAGTVATTAGCGQHGCAQYDTRLDVVLQQPVMHAKAAAVNTVSLCGIMMRLLKKEPIGDIHKSKFFGRCEATGFEVKSRKTGLTGWTCADKAAWSVRADTTVRVDRAAGNVCNDYVRPGIRGKMLRLQLILITTNLVNNAQR